MGNYDYSAIRDHLGKGFADLPEAQNDADFFADKILQCGFEPNNVTKLKNINLKQIQDQIKKFRKTLNNNLDADKKTLIVFYFAGHGVMLENENHIVVLESNKTKQFYRLEFCTQALSKIPNSYVITIFDCCREYMPPQVLDKRGLGHTDLVEEKYLHCDQNFI